MKISKIASLFLVGSAAFIIGCGGGSSSSNTSSTSTKVSGTVVDELIANGIVKVHKNSLNGEVLAQTRTDNNGNYNVSINYNGPVVVEVTCDSNSSFIEENGTKEQCDLSSPLLSANIADGTIVKGNTSPLTSELVGLATNGDLNKTITIEDLQEAKKVITYLYGIDPVITNPIDNSTYKTIINTLHTVAKDDNKTVMDLVRDFVNDAKDGVIGNDNNITKIVLKKLADEGVQSPAIDNNITEINITQLANTNIDGITATRKVIQSLRDNLYSISNEDENGTLDKEAKDFNDAINRDVIKNTQDALFAFSYVLDAAIAPDANMSGRVSQNGNIYDYNVTANSDNTEFNYTITWNDNDYKGQIKTSQDYKSVNNPDDLHSDMFFEINGSLPSTDNKTIYAKATAHKNNDKTFTFDLVDAHIKGDRDYLQIKDIKIDGKYFTYTDDNNETDGDLNYIKLNNIELNSLIDNRFEINGTLSLNWVQNNYVKNKYPEGSFAELYWIQPVVTCEDSNGTSTAPTGGEVIFKFNDTNYTLSTSWSDSYQMAFSKDFDDNPLMMSYKDGNLEDYVKDFNNYDLSNVECPSGYEPQIEWIEEDIDDSFANEGYVPNNITFNGFVKDINTSVEMNGKITAQSSDINSIDITQDNNIPDYKITLNVELKRPDYPDTLINADFTYNHDDQTSKLDMAYNYGDDVITLLGNWNNDQSGNVLVTDENGVKIVIPVNTDGNIVFDKSKVLYNGEEVGKLEDRGDNLPVIHFNDGSVESLN